MVLGGSGVFSLTCSRVFERCLSLERRAAGEDCVQDRPQAVDVGRFRHRSFAPCGLFWRHVRRCPEHGAGLGQLAVAFDTTCQAEVGHERLALVVD